jgi:hypothetical protein
VDVPTVDAQPDGGPFQLAPAVGEEVGRGRPRGCPVAVRAHEEPGHEDGGKSRRGSHPPRAGRPGRSGAGWRHAGDRLVHCGGGRLGACVERFGHWSSSGTPRRAARARRARWRCTRTVASAQPSTVATSAVDSSSM